MIARRIATVVATLLALPGLGACGAAHVETRREEPAAIAPAPAAGAVPVSAIRPVRRDQAVVRNVPAAFALPPGSRVADVSDGESGASFTLTAPDPETVLSFYRRQLPRSAFTVVADRASRDTTSLAFRDADGWAGAIYATAHRVTVAIRRA